jgi:glycosyltransferase involved in cell wall biosynthesis
MSPKVSVILTTHGEGKYLSQAVASVLAQTYTDFELIIAMDGFRFWHNSYFDKRVQIHHFTECPEESNRYCYTINQAFKFSLGQYISYLCHDDLYLPYRLQVMVNVIEKFNLDIVFGSQQLIDDTDPNPDHFWGVVREGSTHQPMGRVDHSSVMHKRECFEKVNGWDESAPMRYGDAYFFKRLVDAGYAFNGISQVLDVHRFNKDSVTWKEDHKEDYPPFDDLGNKRTIESGVDAGWSAVEK